MENFNIVSPDTKPIERKIKTLVLDTGLTDLRILIDYREYPEDMVYDGEKIARTITICFRNQKGEIESKIIPLHPARPNWRKIIEDEPKKS